jgi:hypothetical protein
MNRAPLSDLIDLVIDSRPRDIGAFTVRRLLPSPLRRLVGPFVFFDHMGPAEIAPGGGMDVRPHPHIGLATVTYLFEGEIVHRDSLGSNLPIRPGAVNWMIAGRGIVHSERSAPEWREKGGHIDGIQAWVALPAADEEMEPAFEHHPAESLPVREVAPGVHLRVLAGESFGVRTAVGVRSPTLYADVRMEDGSTLAVPTEHTERAVYVASGSVTIDGRTFEPGLMVVLRPGNETVIYAREASRLMLLGGAPLPEQRFIWWNLVSSDPARLARRADDWRAGTFPKVPGDDTEFIPAPEGPPPHP